MNTTAAHDRYGRLISGAVPLVIVLLCVAPLVIAMSKPAAVSLLCLQTVLLVANLHHEMRLKHWLHHLNVFWTSAAGLALGLLLVWLLASAAWSPSPYRGGLYALHMIGCAVLGSAGVAAAIAVRGKPVWAGRFLLAAMVASSIWLGLNAWLNHEPTKNLGIVRTITNLNRSSLALALAIPIALTLARSGRMRLAIWPTVALASVAIFAGTSESAKLALAAGVLVMLAAPMARLLASAARFGAPALIFLMPVIARLLPLLVPQSVQERLGYFTATVRLEMWDAASRLVPGRWLTGYGAEAGNVIAQDPSSAPLPDTLRAALGWGHPHNAPLQIWLELGLVGALVASFLAYAYFDWVRRLPGPARALGLALGVQVMLIASISHGAWQAWWYAMAASVAMLAYFVLESLSQSLHR